MEPVHYLRAFKRRWAVIAAAIVVAAGVGWVTTATVAPVEPRSISYSATTVLWNASQFGGTGAASSPIPDLAALARVATLPDVLVIVAHKLDYQGNPLNLQNGVQVSTDPQAPFLEVTAIASDARKAERTAEAFGSALIQYLRRLRASQVDRQVASIENQLTLARQSQAGIERITFLQTTLSNLLVTKTLPIGLGVLQHATAAPIAFTGFQAPESRTTRVLIAAAIGLLAGLGLALVLERFDTKIRTRQSAEEHFGYPVLAEIPIVGRRLLRRVAIAERPTSGAADSFRLLAAGVMSGAADSPGDPSGNGDGAGSNGHGVSSNGERGGAPRTILVTSSGPSDGKTTVAANLAGAFGELGKRVLVVSADLRRPSIHRPFGVPVAPGLADLLAIGEGNGGLETQPTKVAGVRMIPSGLAYANPGQLIASPRMPLILEAAERMCDVVVVDSSPVLVASDVTPLLTEVDAVVLVARANRTKGELAERTGEVLRRLKAPVVGLALNCAKEISMPTSYRYYRSKPRTRWGRKKVRVG